MTFTRIALKNIRKKFSSYLIYFFSTAFSVVVFNLFCSMYYNPSFAVYRFGTGKMNALFRVTAIAVLLFATIFVMYSGSYFIKTQKKEIAIYSLLGMKKKQIAIMMFLETFFIGLLAVLAGVLIGTFSTGYFTSLLMRFMAIGTSVTIAVEPRAIIMTVLAFLLLFVISGFRAYQTIYKFTLVDLLTAGKQSEGVPRYSLAGAIASIVLLITGYLTSAKVDLNVGGAKLLLPVLGVIVCVSIGTYLLFRNFVPLAVLLLKRTKPLYYRTSNFISISQISFRLRANSKMLAVAAILCAITITMISATYSLYNGLEDSVTYYAPFSYLAKGVTKQQQKEIENTITDINEVKLIAEDKIELMNIQIQNSEYAVSSDSKEIPKTGIVVDAYLLSETMYLQIISDTEPELGEYSNIKTSFQGGLNDTECYFIDGNVTDEYCCKLAGQEMTVMAGSQKNQYQIIGAGLHKYIGLLDLYQHPTVVVSDRTYASYILQAGDEEITTFYGLMFDDEIASENTIAAIDQIVPARFHGGGLPGNVNYIGFYKANFSLYGPYVFIGLFIGVLFMLAVSSVMYYKLVIEAQEEAPRYEILRKTGMKKNEILSSIAKQLGLVYGIPLLIGFVHTVFALLAYNRMMDLIGQETPTLINASIVALIFIAVYGAFYALSVKSYQSIIWKRAIKNN